MPFIGTATVVQVTDRCFRITGLSLAAGASGTIGFKNNVAAQVQFEEPNWEPYKFGDNNVSLQDLVKVWFNKVNKPFAESEPDQVILVTKAGTTQADFVATLRNVSALQSSELEIYVEKS